MILSNKKLMTNIDDDTVIKVGDEVIERVDGYEYLCHKLKLGLDNQTAEIKRRIGLGSIFTSNMTNNVKLR